MQRDRLPEQQIEVELEEPLPKKMHNYEVLDDALYLITKSNVIASQASQIKVQATTNQKPKNNAKSEAAQAQWEKEEETIRKKLERSSINMMKSKIAQ